MDAFAQTCLQFAFPVYIWALISLIILTSRYSITMSKLVGWDPVAVLATLLLVSYTKVLKIIIDVYSSVKLHHPQHRKATMWLKDANVPYLQSEHLVLAVVTSLVLVFLFLPYTLLLLLGHKLYHFSDRRHLNWLRRVKPFLDSYCAPYKIRTRYWTGFLLLVRCALYAVFSFNSLGSRHTEKPPGHYHNLHCGSFCLRIREGLQPVVCQYPRGFHIPQPYYTLRFHSSCSPDSGNFISIVFVTAVGVIAFHFHSFCITKSAMWLNLHKAVIGRFKSPKVTAESDPSPATVSASSHETVSRTVIELREPLLDDNMH